MVLISGIGTAAEIFVQPGSSIQTAVNNANSGDIITIKPGTYTENIKVNKSDITIRSESGNPDNTIIKAKSTGADVFLLQGNNIKITGLKTIGASRSGYSGINISSSTNCTIENNKLTNNARGIYIRSSKKNIISKNTATSDTEYGIVLGASTGNTISGNTASSNGRGIHCGSSDDNIFSSNTVQGNSVYGLFVCGLSDRNRFYNNYFNDVNMTIRNGIGNSYNTAKKAGTNIVGGPYIGGNFWGKPDGKGFSQTAVDANGDGLSDSAYKNITGSIYSDNLPLVISSSTKFPIANFSSNVTSGTVPLNVAFTDTSTNTPTAWNWSFGDGTANSTVKNPTHKYSNAGTYTVTLTATNSAGSSTIKKSSYITASSTTPPALVANFSSNVTSGTAPLNVAFADKSTGTPTAWNWSLGDGTYSTVKNPAHLYSKAGNYTVKLTVKNAAGSTNTVTKTNYIKVATSTTAQKPVISFWGSKVSGPVPLTITFTDASTGTPTAWNWNFGDGTANSTLKNPRHTYSNAGTYSVTLTASNTAGSTTKTRANYITVTK